MTLVPNADEPFAMVRDLRTILDGWDFEPGKISVRKIIGADTREKIQARVDMGVMQFEVDGRPDGSRPEGFESLLRFHEQRLLEHQREFDGDDEFKLGPEHCRRMRHEAYLYHQRYVSLFVLEEYQAVERDTEITLRLIDLCQRYAAAQRDREALSAYRNYALMMNSRSRALQQMQAGELEKSLAIVEAGLVSLEQAAESLDDGELPDPVDNSGEIELLTGLRDDIIAQMPGDALPKLRQELAAALHDQDYERAAAVRDRIGALDADGPHPTA
jgi:hypothetical protein